VNVTIRCLLVDDSEEFLRSAARLLESAGFETVGLAHTSAEALELAAEHEPELALVDIELGEEDGIELADELLAQSPAMRVILISAHEREDLREAIAKSSAAGFIPKSRLGADAITALL
jgi:two-component system nitrate/nitrite response regulator NarL